jgi:hypothetical protein
MICREVRAAWGSEQLHRIIGREKNSKEESNSCTRLIRRKGRTDWKGESCPE